MLHLVVLDRRLAVIHLAHALHHHHQVGIVIQIKKAVTTIGTVTVTIETIGITETTGTTGTTDVRILVKNPMIVIGIVVKLNQKNVSLNSYREWPHNRMTSCLSGENNRESGGKKTLIY